MTTETERLPKAVAATPSTPAGADIPAETDVPAEPVPPPEALVKTEIVGGVLYVHTPNYCGPDRRVAGRRREPMGFFSLRQLSLHRERRHPGRRAEDWETPYVDWYEPKLLAIAVGIILLAAADAFLTLQLWQHDVVLLSPWMARLIENNVNAYIYCKLAVVGLVLLLLMVYKNFRFYRIFRVVHVLYALFAVYFLFVANELYAWLLL